MDRLTKRDGKKVWFAQGRPRGFLCPDEFCRNAKHCKKVKDRTCPYLQLLDKLAAYEDAEEQGRLVVLPCKVGTPVWSSVMCRFDENGEEQPMQWPFMLSMMDEWGTGFFLTYEEAEAALKGESKDV